MTAPQVHLMLNHVPVIGVVFAAIALAWGLLRRSDTLVKFGLAALVALSFAAVPVFLTGEPSEHAIEKMVGVSKPPIERHEDAARMAMIGLGVLGLGSLVTLIGFRRRPVTHGTALLVLVTTLALSGILAWTAHLGGQIRHPELRPAGVATAGDAGSDAKHGGHD